MVLLKVLEDFCEVVFSANFAEIEFLRIETCSLFFTNSEVVKKYRIGMESRIMNKYELS